MKKKRERERERERRVRFTVEKYGGENGNYVGFES